MRRHIGLSCLALAALALGACGDGEGGTTAFTPAQLSEGLLTAGDLGTGWTETQRDTFDARQPENPVIDPSLWCPAADTERMTSLAGQAGADVELTFGATDTVYFVREQAWSNPDVDRYFAAVKSAVSTCSGAPWNDSEGNTYTLKPSTAQKVGDASVSWTVLIQTSSPSGMVTVESDHTVAKFGDVAMVLQGSASPTAGAAALAVAPSYLTILAAASDKLAGVVTP